MSWDRIEGSWKQLKAKAKEQWGRLTDDELDQAAGRREQLVGKPLREPTNCILVQRVTVLFLCCAPPALPAVPVRS